MGRKAADQGLGELAGLTGLQDSTRISSTSPRPTWFGHHLIVEDPLLGFGDRDRFCEQVVHLDDIDAAIAHLLHEVEVVALGIVHPQDIVEQQGVAIAWG